MSSPRMVFVIGLEAPGPVRLRRRRRWVRSRTRTAYPLGLGVCIDDRGREAEASTPCALGAESGACPTGAAPTPPVPGIGRGALFRVVVPGSLRAEVSQTAGLPGRRP